MDLSKTNYIIRLYAPGDEDKIVKLLIDVFKSWPRFDVECSPVDHWRWKFIDNLAGKKAPHVVAEYDGEIVGCSHGMFFDTKIGKTTILCEKGADDAIQEKHRGKGLSSKVADLRENSVHEILGSDYFFSYFLSNNPKLLTHTSKYVPPFIDFPQPLKSLIKINDVDKHFKHASEETDPVKKMLLKTGVHGLKTLNKLDNLGVKPSQLKDVAFREITRFDEGIDIFYEKVKPHYNFFVERTKDYMNWRYCDKRGGDYKVWIAEKNDEIVGYLVLRINRIDADYPKGYIMDLLALNDRDDVADYFAKFAVDYFDEGGVNVVYAQVVGGHPYEGILSKYGLLGTMAKYHLMYRAKMSSDDLEMFVTSPPAMLHYTHGEGDSI